MSKQRDLADERVREHARFLADALINRVEDDGAPAAAECETVFELYLIAYVASAVRNISSHSGDRGADGGVDFQTCLSGDSSAAGDPRRLVGEVKWWSSDQATCSTAGSERLWRESYRLLVAAKHADQPDDADHRCVHTRLRDAITQWADDAPQHRHRTGEEGAEKCDVDRVAQRCYRALNTVLLLEESSLGSARSRASRRRTPPKAVREVLNRVAARTRPAPSGDESDAPG